MSLKALRPMCALTVAGLIAGGASAQVTLDDFGMVEMGVWPVELNESSPMFSATEFNGTGVGDLLSRRNTTGEFESAEIGEIDEAEVGIFAQPGLLNYASFAGAEAKLTLTYDGQSGTGIGAILDDQDTVLISLSDFDAAFGSGMLISVGVVFADTTDASGDATVTTTGPQDIAIPIAFTGSAVDSISITFEPDRGADFRLDDITLVPEPVTAALLALGGLAAFRRR